MSYRDFETRKSLHINLPIETHANLKIVAFKAKLSMQEIFEELATQLVEDDPHMCKILENLKDRKRRHVLRGLSSPDKETIFDVIEQNNPLDRT
tara:strand:- start:453 stop:734 length:282 start_codon:yes stop_codon:yes gene_type:complete